MKATCLFEIFCKKKKKEEEVSERYKVFQSPFTPSHCSAARALYKHNMEFQKRYMESDAI